MTDQPYSPAPKSKNDLSVDLHAHPPERRDPGGPVYACCCCCCCCCLHSLGGLTGAGIAAARPPLNDQENSAASLYWIVLGLLTVGTVFWPGVDAEASVLIVLLTLPGIQLAASLVTALVLACSSSPRKEARLRHIGRISVYMVLGTLLGIAAMFLLAGVFQLF